jgi:hypothetical protein
VELRHELSTVLPRTGGALGRLLSLDTLHAVPLRDGTTALTLGIAVHPERARAEFPSFVAYLEKYVLPARFHLVVRDRGGAAWLDAQTAPSFLTLRMRLKDGVLLPLAGPERPFPDSLQLTGELYLRAMVFDVGVSRLVADLAPLRGPHEAGFTLRFAREPEWHLPPVVGHLMRGALQRPFRDHGILLRLAVRDSPTGGQTLAERDLHVDVQESAIVRWLNSLGSAAVSDMTGKVELERDRFVGEAFQALQEDLRVRFATAGLAAEP